MKNFYEWSGDALESFETEHRVRVSSRIIMLLETEHSALHERNTHGRVIFLSSLAFFFFN